MDNYIKKTKDALSLLAKIIPAIGFIFAAVYFYSIGYFPIDDPSIFLALIPFVAFASIYSFIFIAGPLIFAPCSWVNLILMPDVLYHWLKNDAAVTTVINSYKIGKFDFDSKTRLHIGLRYIAFMLLYLLILYGTFYYNHSKYLPIFYFLSLIAFVLSVFLEAIFSEEKNKKAVISKFKKKIIIYIKIICYTMSSGLFLFLGIGLILLLITKSTDHNHIKNYEIVEICLAAITTSTACLFSPKNLPFSLKNWISTVGPTFVFFLLICFMYGLFSTASSAIMSTLKLGSINNAMLEIDNIACQAFSEAHYPIRCNPKIKNYIVRNINVKWRGNEYYILLKSEEQTMKLFIPKKHILWSSFTENNHK